jgi:hypothetical protein
MMTVLNFTAEWDWENADPEPESYGYVTLRVHGFEIARIPMTFWHVARQDEPSDAQVEEAIGEWLTDMAQYGRVARALTDEATRLRHLPGATGSEHLLLNQIAISLERIAKAADGRPSFG